MSASRDLVAPIWRAVDGLEGVIMALPVEQLPKAALAVVRIKTDLERLEVRVRSLQLVLDDSGE